MKKLFLLMMLISSSAFCDTEFVTNQVEIKKVLSQIPYTDREMPYKSVADRLPNLGLTAIRMSIGKLEREDYENTDGKYKKGDVLYSFTTNEPNKAVKAICPIWSSFEFIKRGKKWIPDSKTANFLMSYKCEVPS